MKEIRFPEVNIINGKPEIIKSGIISSCGGENSVFVWKEKFMRLENHWDGFGEHPGPCAVVCDYEGTQFYSPFGTDRAKFFSCYCENDIIYAYATKNNKIHCYISTDLIDWDDKIILEFPENFQLFNTSVCKGDGCYMMAVEASAAEDGKGNFIGEENPYIGICFTEFFAKSDNLINWELLPFDKGYTKERYNACPALKYCDGQYYMICLEELPCYRFAPYIYRTKDFDTWEIGFYNPLFIASNEDLYPKKGVNLSPHDLDMQFRHLNTNNSDIDLCEYQNKTYIVYCSGNQGITWGGCTCEAIFDGSLDDFLKSNFS